MDDVRPIDASKISDNGLVIARVGKFVLRLHNDKSYSLESVDTIDIDGFSIDLCKSDIDELFDLFSVLHDWHIAHKLAT